MDLSLSPEQRAAIEQRTLLGRIPNIAEIEGPLLFLASDASRHVTGTAMYADAGISLYR